MSKESVNPRHSPRNFIRSVIEVSHVGFSDYDMKNHALIYSSGLAETILGYTAEEMKEFSRNYNREIIHPDDLEKVNRDIQRLEHSEPGEIIETIVRYKRRDGQYIWGYTRKMVTEWDKNEKPSKMTVIAEDVTEFMTLKQQMEQKVKELEHMSFRNHHEIRGPVASILGLANMMQDESMIAEYNKEIMQHLCRAVDKLDHIVSDLSDSLTSENN